MKRIGILAIIASALTIIFFTFNVFATDKGRPYYEEKGYVLWDIKTEDKIVAITFDDGPHPKYTEEILDVLENIKLKPRFSRLVNMQKSIQISYFENPMMAMRWRIIRIHTLALKQVNTSNRN